MRSVVLFLLLVGVSVVRAGAEPTPPVDKKVSLQLSLVGDRREFHFGEIIPIKLSFSSRVKKHYQLDEAYYDRSGRMHFEHFSVTPAKGAVDPIPPDAFGIMGGGLTNFMFLSPKPWSIRLNLNEWVRFTEPGEYKLTVSSDRVEARDPASPRGTSPITARSNEIILKILPVDRDWQKRAFDQAVATINAHPPNPDEIRFAGDLPTSAEIAWNTLRFLGTEEAATELAKRLRGEGSGNNDFICYMGLVSSPEHAAARDALKKALADPNHPINETFLDALRIIESEHPSADSNTQEEQKKAEEDEKKLVEELIAVLPAKRDRALAVSLNTAVNEAWNQKTLPQKTVDKLVNQLIPIFDELPLREQRTLLGDRWNKIQSPALLPIVRRYAQVSRDFLNKRGDPENWDSSDLITSAIKRWFELDPIGARPFIIKEITQRAPRFGAGVLGILPDETLPEVDSQLAEHFIASDKDFEGSSNAASLIARYATPAILPQILKELDVHVGKWACDIQTSILAYVLRVDPRAARSRIERAIAARGGDFTGCYRRLFEDVSSIHYDPVLEEIAIHALNNRNPEVAASAATMLGKFGSPAAESALLLRYQSWNNRWAESESKLKPSLLADAGTNGPLDDRRVGYPVVRALATGQGWLTDRTKLQRLKGLNKVRSIQRELDGYMRTWDKQPLTISVSPLSEVFPAEVAQYQLGSTDALEQKLAQFPTGTEFALSIQEGSKAGAQYVARLRTFLISHGMSIKEEERDR